MSEKPRIGVVGLMTEVYRNWPDVQKKLESWAKEVCKRMDAFGDVSYSGYCDTREEVEKAVRSFEEEGRDLLIAFPIAYSPSLIALSALKETRLPIVVLNTQILNHWPSTVSPECFGDNQAPTGVFDLTNALVRAQVSFDIVSGQDEDPAMYNELKEWARVAKALKRIRKTKVGIIGYPMQDSGDFAVDHLQFISQLGVSVWNINMAEMAALTEKAPEKEIEASMEWDREHFDVDDSLDQDAHRASARLEWACRELVKKYDLSSLTFHFDAMAADGRFETLPMVGISKLLSQGVGFGGEGDVTSAALVSICNQLCDEVDFFESWGMDFKEGGVLKNHMGEGNIALARKDRKVRLTKAPFGLGENVSYNVVPGYTLKEGDATFVNLTTSPSGCMRIIAAEGRVPDFPPIKGIDTPHGKFLTATPFPEFLRRYAKAGGTHHGALMYGHMAGLLEKTAYLLGIEFEEV